ncbi:MAG: DEAD/DEAH box helicase [Patescibacteria group bacterium]
MTQNILASVEDAQFKNLGIGENILRTLDRNGWITPTPIQNKVIPTGLEGKDIIGIAQTGTGKTLGFGIPMIQRVISLKKRGLVVVPTRELAIQVDEILRKLGGPLGIYTTVLIGGEPMGRQLRSLRNRPEVIIATPGRLLDIVKQGNVRLENFNILVLDEADRMFDIGFLPQIKEIMKKMPKERQTLLFSATMPPAVSSLAAEYMTLPFRIEVAPSGATAERVEQEIIVVAKSAKISLLTKLIGESPGPVLVFTRTKHSAKHVAHALRDAGFTATEIHSNRSLGQRRDSLDGFKRGKYRVMVATDIAARGIDVKDIALVVNFDLPEQTEDYVHRIGRTARAGQAGKAISFAMPEQHRDILMIERLIKKTLPIKSHAGATIVPGSSYRPGRAGGSGQKRSSSGKFHSISFNRDPRPSAFGSQNGGGPRKRFQGASRRNGSRKSGGRGHFRH